MTESSARGAPTRLTDPAGNPPLADDEISRDSEEQYRATFELAAVGISHVGLDGRWIRFNDAVCSITGYSREELSQKTFADITHPDDLERDWAQARRVAAGEIDNYSLEKRYIRKNGSLAWVQLSVSLLRNRAGDPRCYIAIIQEIGDRKRAQAAVQERETRLRGIVEAMPDAFMVLDRAFRIGYVNQAWEQTFGVSRRDAQGAIFCDRFPGARGTNMEGEFKRAMLDHVAVEFESYYGPWQRWFLNRAFPNADGGLTAFTRDVTSRHATQQALEESEQRYRSLVSATSAVVWVANAKGEFAAPQASWEAYTGQTWQAHAGDNWAMAVHPDDRARVLRAWRAAVESRTIYDVEWRAWHAESGQWRHCVTRAVPVLDCDGEVREWVGAVTDVHDRTVLAAQLQQEDKFDSLGVLAGGVAHDFNNLLVGVMGNASLAMEHASPRIRPMLQQVVKAAERAADLTRQMLAYVGKGQLVVQPVHLSQQVREVVNLLRSTFDPAVQVELDVADSLPLVLADRGQMQQIAANLIINAGEALGEKGGRIRVSTAAGPDHQVLLTVQDSGGGMTPEVKARIFEPFFSTKFTGRGLGLAAVMGIVRSHKGAIEVDSAPGQGTTFRVSLPAMERSAAAASTVRSDPPALEQAPIPMTVLAIDDEEVVLSVVKNTLAGMRILRASSGREGIELFQERKAEIDLVILDATMPDVGGREVLRFIRGLRPDIPVIVSSGHPLAQVERYFGDEAPSAVLSKPYKPAALRALVAEHAGKTRVA